MTNLLFAKIAMALTVGFVGLNLHQLFSPYKYVKGKIVEFSKFVKETGDKTSLNIMSLLFYVLVPGVYLILLAKAEFFNLGMLAIGLKFLVTASFSYWVQKNMILNGQYPRWIHVLSKSDNILNVIFSAAVAYFLIFPV